jgi:hypothetical protein
MCFDILKRKPVVKSSISLLCIATLLLLSVLAASPALHHHIHHDADHADHHCAVTMLASGQVLLAAAAPLIVRPMIFSWEKAAEPDFVFIATDHPLLPGRAPPSDQA